MRLIDFLQMIASINPNLRLFVKIDGQLFAISQLKLSAKTCWLHVGDHPLTLKAVRQLAGHVHDKNGQLLIQRSHQNFDVFGLQINLAHKQVILM